MDIGLGHPAHLRTPHVPSVSSSVTPTHRLAHARPAPILLCLRQLALGPEAVVSILTGATLLTLAPGDTDAAVERRIALAVTLTFFVGLLALALGLLRLGYVESLLSRATNRGFVTGVACVIMIEQLPKFFGLTDTYEPDDTPIAKLVFVCQHLYQTEPIAAGMGACVFAFLLAVGVAKKRWARWTAVRLFPSIMAAVVITILVTWGLRLDTRGLAILGDVDGGFVAPRAPTVHDRGSSAASGLV